jgi:hypothetical protein
MTRKGKVAEIFSNALYHDDSNEYSVGYIDLGKIKEVSLPNFLKLSENFQTIPASRISYIKKINVTIYSKVKDNKELDQN